MHQYPRVSMGALMRAALIRVYCPTCILCRKGGRYSVEDNYGAFSSDLISMVPSILMP